MKHSIFEDIQAILSGTLLIALGILAIKTAGLVTGGITGFSLLLHYYTGFRFGILLLLFNLPFYFLAWFKLSQSFAIKTIISVVLLSFWTEYLPRWLAFGHLNLMMAAVISGVLIGIGMLMLFRHQASVGGIGILAAYLQKHKNISAGYIQLVFDVLIVSMSFFVVAHELLIYSIVSVVVLNILLAINHKPGRYLAG